MSGTPEPAGTPSASQSAPARRIAIDPVTRLEGHGRVEILLDPQGEVERAVYQVTELRGFEAFCAGRRAEDMPQITSRICGVCPMAHHLASTKALDELYSVQPPPAAVRVRELVYHAFLLDDHALHVYFLGGPDLFVGPDAPPERRTIAGVTEALGEDAVRTMMAVRARLRGMVSAIAGRAVHPVLGLPGGVAKGVEPAALPEFREIAAEGMELATATLERVREATLRDGWLNAEIESGAGVLRTYYMGLVDAQNRPSFCDGVLRVVGPDGTETGRFAGHAYQGWIGERTEPWTYARLCYLKPVGWSGLTDGPGSGIYAVGPLARLNVADSMATPLAQRALEEFRLALGPPPVHHTMAHHWARAIEMVYAAERLTELLHHPEIASAELRRLPTRAPASGVGVVEAPRGTLLHRYETDEEGLLREVDLIAGTQHNAARIAMSVEQTARRLIRGGHADEGLLSRIEMAFRAYDPCNACASHASAGGPPVVVRLQNAEGRLARKLQR